MAPAAPIPSSRLGGRRDRRDHAPGPRALGGTGGDGAATAPPTGEDAEAQVTARRLRELQKTTGHLREAAEQHGEQLASVGEQLQELGEQVARTSARHTDLAAAVSEDLAPRVSSLSRRRPRSSGSSAATSTCCSTNGKERETTKNAPVMGRADRGE